MAPRRALLSQRGASSGHRGMATALCLMSASNSTAAADSSPRSLSTTLVAAILSNVSTPSSFAMDRNSTLDATARNATQLDFLNDTSKMALGKKEALQAALGDAPNTTAIANITAAASVEEGPNCFDEGLNPFFDGKWSEAGDGELDHRPYWDLSW